MTTLKDSMVRHNEPDLVQLARYHAYKGSQKLDELEINRGIFEGCIQ